MSDSDDENNFTYGTPLDPYDEDQLPRKKPSYQDVAEQYALDDNGKRRFHGAFTGGFTAGYGNTVAAPEGWTPTAFKSSRSDRTQKNVFQKPEDFMDEEDRSEFGIKPREIQPTREFGGYKRKKQTQFHDGPIPGDPVLQVLLQPVHETAAMKILRSMGWRPGKGIGEKMTAAERNKKVYTCFIPENLRKADAGCTPEEIGSDKDSADSEDDEYSDALFEPNDLEPFMVKPKTDTFGIGYSGLSRHSVLGSFQNEKEGGKWRGSHLVTSDKGKKVSIRGQAFGVGAMEEDDEDIYAKDDMSNYDFALETKANLKLAQLSSSKKKPSPVSHRTVLEGFVPAAHKGATMKVYPPPALPRNFTPSGPKSSRFSVVQNTSVDIRDRGLGRHELTAKSRGVILGEVPFVETTASIEKLSPSSDKQNKTHKTMEERIAEAAGRSVSFVTPSSSRDNEIEFIPNEEETPVTTSEFKPFASNPEKQRRYEKFVELKECGREVKADDLNTFTTNNKLTEWERVREASAFQQAYKLYKPLTGLMNERFVSATRSDDDIALGDKHEGDSMKYASKEKQEAARLGMFGKLTRDVTRWVPESLLCRRFNVAEPYNGGYANEQKGKKKLTYSIFEYLENPVHNKDSFLKEQTGVKDVLRKDIEKTQVDDSKTPTDETNLIAHQTPTTKRLTVAELFMQEKEREREKLIEKPQLQFQKEISTDNPKEPDTLKETIDNFNKIDLYKAIFLSDSESDSEKVEESNNSVTDEQSHSKEISIISNAFESPPRNVERNDSPPKGIFANLNFDRLNSWQNSSTRKENDMVEVSKEKHIFEKKTTKDEKQSDDKSNKNAEVDNNLYGPKLPEKHVFIPSHSKSISEASASIEIDSSSDSSDSWVEVNKLKQKKSKSKKKKDKKSNKKKHREHKHKSKRKHKKKSDSR